MNKKIWHIFLLVLLMINNRELFRGSKRCFDTYCASYNVFSLGHKKSLETNFSIKAIFPVTKNFGFFVRNIECAKPQGTLCKGATGIFCNNQGVVEKTSFWKKASFSGEQNCGVFFFVISNITNVREQLIRAHMVIWQVSCQRFDHFF